MLRVLAVVGVVTFVLVGTVATATTTTTSTDMTVNEEGYEHSLHNLRTTNKVFARWNRHLAPILMSKHWHPTEFYTNSDTFNHQFVDKMSRFTYKANQEFKFMLIGACDGDAHYDDHLMQFYHTPHWYGAFVEAYEPNVHNLTSAMKANSATSRGLVVHAAISDACEADTVRFGSPITNPDIDPHWYRRQIGRIATATESNRPDWTYTEVACVTGADVSTQFKAMLAENTVPRAPDSEHIAHLLRIDIEDASVAVMKSLLQPLHSYELPLLVMVEIKSTKRAVSANGWDSECDDTSEFLLSKGYDISPCGQDLFAVLKPEWIA